MEIVARTQLAAQSGADSGNTEAREQAIKVQRAYSEPVTESLINVYA